MMLVARASKTVRNKNFIIVFMCGLFVGWFAYDGYHTYPANDDRIIAALLDKGVSPENENFFHAWKGWNNESDENRMLMDQFIKDDKTTNHVEGWKEIADIRVQRWIVNVLGVAFIGSLVWFFLCQRRRAIADEQTVSPAAGVIIPWDKITIVDNSRWKSMGIVEITYRDETGQENKASFDDYKLERDALLPILELLAEKATGAEFLPKEPAPNPQATN